MSGSELVDYILGAQLSWGNVFLVVFLWLPVLIWLGKELTMGICYSKKRLDGTVSIVTGANAGIGFETALGLARRGGRVYLACRNAQRGEAAVRKMRESSNGGDVRLLQVDLSSLQSVRDFVDKFKSMEDKLDLLVNNAGIGAGYLIGQDEKASRTMTKDGLEITMQSNHYSHFLMTQMLKDHLDKSDDPRVVNVCSDSHMYVDIDLDNLNFEKEFIPDNVYGTTKLANMLFTKEISRRWGKIKSFAPHPGMVRTNFFDQLESMSKTKIIINVIWNWMGKSAEQGAQAVLYCCLEDGLNSGGFFMDCMELTNVYHKSADDKELCSKFWEKSVKLVGLSA